MFDTTARIVLSVDWAIFPQMEGTLQNSHTKAIYSTGSTSRPIEGI